MQRVYFFLALCILPEVFWGIGPVWAHDLGLSVADLRLTESQVIAHLTFARRDMETLVPMDADLDGVVVAAEFAAAYPQLAALADDILVVQIDGQRLSTESTAIELDESDALHIRYTLARQPGTRLSVSLPVIVRLGRGHRQYAAVRNAQGGLLMEVILEADHAMFDLPLAAAATPAQGSQSFWQFFRLGVAHIVTGYDHLLFLFGLLVIGGTFWSACRIITSFTVAHSITLALATFNIIRLPASLVEPLIAGSIIYVGLENLWQQEPPRRWLLTFGFGLIHGLGFAAVLRNLGIGGQAALVPLLSFNCGVECGQMAIALLILPLMWKVQTLPRFFPHFARACSCLVTLTGTYWLCERTLLS